MRGISCLNLQWYHILIILPPNSMITQLQKLWMYYYKYLLIKAQLFSDGHTDTEPV